MAAPTVEELPGWLHDWLGRLDRAGFHIGLRERLLVHALLARMAVSGSLPDAPVEAARLLAPLLCTSPKQQRDYADLLDAWPHPLAEGAGRSPGNDSSPAARPAGKFPRLSLAVWALLLAALLALTALAWQYFGTGDPIAPPAPSASAALPPPTGASGGATAVPPASRPDVYVPPRAMPFGPARAPQWPAPLRIALSATGLLAALAMVIVAWRRSRRALVLKGVRSDEAVEDTVLRERHRGANSVAPSPGLAGPVSRLLRQRMAGARHELDLPATVQATLRAGGVFMPSWRMLSQTPEYLVLIDSRSASDHLVQYQRTLVEALAARGVALSLFEFERTPANGCWRVKPGRHGPERYDRSTLAEVAARHADQRLMVFADPECALDATTGEPLRWALQLKRQFQSAVWFSPRPLASWGSAEQRVAGSRELDFLMLPVHPESLETVAGWFSSARAHLQLPPDLPGPWPTLLGDDALELALRHTPPPAADVERLLFELRQYLGGWRFQWLAACAVFPMLSWPLTLGLGTVLLDAEGVDERARMLALGMAALGPLPWFRYGRMPFWLRQALADRLSADNDARCRALIEVRLDNALTEGGGEVLVKVALRRAWLRRRGEMARDLVLVDFLQRRDHLSRLVQRLPERLRRLLFQRGRPAFGLQPAWLALPAIGVVVGALAWTPLWDLLIPQDTMQQLLQAEAALPPTLRGGVIASLETSSDGLSVLVLERSSDGRSALRWIGTDGQPLQPTLVGVPPRLLGAALSRTDGQIGLFDDLGVVGAWQRTSGRAIYSEDFAQNSVTAIAFDSQGPDLAVSGRDGSISVTAFSGARRLVAPRPGAALVQRLRYRADGGQLASLDAAGQVALWDLPGGSAHAAPPGPGRRYTALTYAAEGGDLWLADDQGTVERWGEVGASWRSRGRYARPGDPVATVAVDPSSGRVAVGWRSGVITVHDDRNALALALGMMPGSASAAELVFSPDGSRLLSGGTDGNLRSWGALRGGPLRVVGCPADAVADTVRRWTLFSLFGAGLDGSAEYAIAYTPLGVRNSGQPSPVPPGAVQHDPGDARQVALARRVLARLQTDPRKRAAAWRSVEAPGTQAVTVNVCGESALIEPQTPPAPAASSASSPAPLAGQRFEILECNAENKEGHAVAQRVQTTLKRLGAADVKRVENGPATASASPGAIPATYEIRLGRGRADEAAIARRLRADRAFSGNEAWRVVEVAPRIPSTISIAVCSGQTSVPGANPTPVLPRGGDPAAPSGAVQGGTPAAAKGDTSGPPQSGPSEASSAPAPKPQEQRPAAASLRAVGESNLYVLSVGVDDYANPELPKLRNSWKGASDFAQLMRRQEGSLYRQVKASTMQNPSRAEMLEALNSVFKASTSQDVVMLFMAGHAMTDAAGKTYFLAADSDPTRLDATAIGFFEIAQRLTARRATVVAFVDACPRAVGGGERGSSPPPRSAQTLDVGMSDRTVVYSACSAGGLASDPGGLQNSPFTAALLDGLRGAADADRNAVVTSGELSRFVTSRVRVLSAGRQVPVTVDNADLGELPLADVRPPTTQPSAR